MLIFIYPLSVAYKQCFGFRWILINIYKKDFFLNLKILKKIKSWSAGYTALHKTKYQIGVIPSSPFNSSKPEFTIVIFIHYKPRISIAILDL